MFVSEMIDQLRDLLNDATDTQVPYATKKLYLNRGIARLWPTIYYLDEQSISLDAGVREYLIQTDLAKGQIVSIWYDPTGLSSNYNVRLGDYDIIDGDAGEYGYIRIPFVPNDGDTLTMKIAYEVPLITAASYAAAQAEVWIGPERAIGLPVLYAMGMIAARKLDDRQDSSRYSTTQALNGVTDNDLMTTSAMWFGQFAEELAAMEMPLPIARD